MFILRKITGRDGVQINISLGESYTLVSEIDTKLEFDKTMNEFYKEYPERDKIYGFVTGEGGRGIHPLYNTQQNYIMTENGETFSNITPK